MKDLKIIQERWPKLAENLISITSHHDVVGIADQFVIDLIYSTGNYRTLTYNDNFELVERLNKLEEAA